MGLRALVGASSTVLVGVGALAGCTAPDPPARSPRGEPELRVSLEEGPGRLVILPVRGPRPLEVEDPDGTRRSVVSGMRVVEHPDGRFEHAADLLLSTESVRAFALPSRLGGGYVFIGHDGGETLLWRTGEWTAPLRPLARLPFETADLATGFDRLYVTASGKGASVAVDASDGHVLADGVIPAAPAYGTMAFADSWLAGVETDIRGPLLTFDAGMTWHSLGMLASVPAFEPADGVLVVNTPRGRFGLGPSGRLERLDSQTRAQGPLPERLDLSDIAIEPERIEDEESPRRASAAARLAEAVLRGVRLSSGDLIVATRDGWSRFDVGAAPGRVAVPEAAASCWAGKLGTRPLFACQDGGDTTLGVAAPGGTVVEVARFEGARVVVFGENGHIVVRGGCDSPQRDSYCVLTPGGDLREVQVHGDVGVERFAALADGRSVVVVPPRLGAAASLTLVGASGSRSRALDLSGLARDARELAERALWLEGPVEVESGQVAVWAVGASRFVGLRLAVASGKVTAGEVHDGLLDTHFAGPRALSITPGGALMETLNGGLDWTELRVPGRVVERMRADDEGKPSAVPRGCSRAGCVLGSWLRLGWGQPNEAHALREAPRPERVEPERPLYTTWNLTCEYDGRATRPVLGKTPAALPSPRPFALAPSRRLSRASTAIEDLESSAFRPFLGYRAPTVPSGALAFDFGTEEQTVQVRGYVWGPRDGAWDRSARWLARGVDRFEAEPPWSTRVSSTRWADALEGARRFGSDPSHRQITRWQALFDPGGEHGLLRIQTSQDVETFVLQRDRPIVAIDDPQGLTAGNVTGVVVVDDELYVGVAPSARAFRIIRVEGQQMRLVGTYPRYADAPVPELVRATGGNALGIAAVASGHFGPKAGAGAWFVFPVDRATGEALAPVVVPRETIAQLPRACSSDDDGWLVLQTISRSIARAELADGGRVLPIGDVEARLVVREGDVCLGGLAANARGGPLTAEALGARGDGEGRSVSLVVNDHAGDRRFGFRCGG